MRHGRSGLSRPETRLMTRRVSASFAMVVRTCCVWFMTVAPHEPVAHQGSCCRDPHKGTCCKCSCRGRRSWCWHALRWDELDVRGGEIGQGREELWETVGDVHVGREEGAVCRLHSISKTDSLSRQRRARRKSALGRGQEAKFALSCAGRC